jgi:hypothetical protein
MTQEYRSVRRESLAPQTKGFPILSPLGREFFYAYRIVPLTSQNVIGEKVLCAHHRRLSFGNCDLALGAAPSANRFFP